MTETVRRATARSDELRAVARSPWWDGLLERWGVRGVVARDGLLAILWAVGSVAVLLPLRGVLNDVAQTPFTATQEAALLIVVAGQALLLWFRRIRPATCLLLVAAFQVAIGAIIPPEVSARVAAPVIAAYTVGTLVRNQRLVRVVAATVLLEVLGGALVATYVGGGVRSFLVGDTPAFVVEPVNWAVVGAWGLEYLLVLLLYLCAVLAGVWVAARRDYLELVKVSAASAILEQRARADMVIESERLRMARELHDIAAHHLSGLVVQASAVERLIDRDPEAAKEGARSIRAQGKETLDNLRMVVGVLRERAEGDRDQRLSRDAGAPVPGLEALDGLVESARELGDRIDFEIRGQPGSLPPIASVTGYRVAQEALANARQHAPGHPVRLRLEYADRGIRMQVDNPMLTGRSGDAGREGFGLIGMQERAALAGGEFSAGPDEGDQWRVTLSIPGRPGGEEQP